MDAVSAIGGAISATVDEASEGLRSGKTSARESQPGTTDEPARRLLEALVRGDREELHEPSAIATSSKSSRAIETSRTST